MISCSLNRHDTTQRADLGTYWARPRVSKIGTLLCCRLIALQGVHAPSRTNRRPCRTAGLRIRHCADLTTETGLAVGTVRRAIDILVKEGLVQTVPGRGTFVRR